MLNKGSTPSERCEERGTDLVSHGSQLDTGLYIAQGGQVRASDLRGRRQVFHPEYATTAHTQIDQSGDRPCPRLLFPRPYGVQVLHSRENGRYH